MTTPQTSNGWDLTQARNELHALDQIAETRTLTDDERDEVRFLRKYIDLTTRVVT